jgi:predicted O-linked N-acetylglucosamine transferase (SPINDLY family)
MPDTSDAQAQAQNPAEAALQTRFEQASALHQQGKLADAERIYREILRQQPNHFGALHLLGVIALQTRHTERAVALIRKAIGLNGNVAAAHSDLGKALLYLKHSEEALASFDQAIALKPDDTEAWFSRGIVFHELERHGESADAFAQVLKIDPNYPFAKGAVLHHKMLCCDWNGVGNLIAEIDGDVAAGRLSATPFGWQGVSSSQRSLQICAELFNEKNFPANIESPSRRFFANRKIRIGYLSGEFRSQATSTLLVGVLEEHDSSCFEIYAFDNGWDDQSELRKRINGSVQSVINIRQLSDSSAGAAICKNQIDILVDLNGYFGEYRTQVFAERPAPIQVNYLGFPGTLGAKYIDYIIADRQVVPANHEKYYSEKIVYLPNCYQANDRKRKIATRNFSRVEFGLPESCIVFCCFNNNYKITPRIFDCWMRILKQIDGSVLWLLEGNANAVSNLRKEAVERGVNAERLIFAKRMSLQDHLARHRLADLFLDTLPYNAHTTASDALWAGLPILTCLGETFAGRVAASLVNAIGLPELVTTTLEAYEQMAIDLAMHPVKLAAIKRKLAENRMTTPLFDTQLFTKHIEAAYTAMYDRHQAGLPPENIIIPN